MPVGVRGLLQADELTSSERLLCTGAVEGRLVDLENPEDGSVDGEAPHRRIRAQVIYQLLTGDGPRLADTIVAVRLRGAQVPGDLVLAGARLRCPLELLGCDLGGLDLATAEAPVISLAGSHLSGGFHGERLTVTHTLDLSSGFRCDDGVVLDRARIGGTLDGSGSRLAAGSAEAALSAEGLRVGADLLLDSARCSGPVVMDAAEIGGTLLLSEAELDGGDVAFSGDGLVVGNNMFTRGIRSSGQFTVFNARVTGQLTCTGGSFRNPGGLAFHGEQLVVGSYLFLRRVHCEGEVRLLGARVGADLDCAHATFDNPGEVALDGRRVVVDADLGLYHVSCNGVLSIDSGRIRGEVTLENARCAGVVRVDGADIGGTLDLTAAELHGSDHLALSAENLVVGKDVFTRWIQSSGEFSLFNARVAGQVTCTRGTFRNPGGKAFNGEQLVVDSYLFLRHVHCDGQVRLFGARVGAQLDCGGATFDNPDDVAVYADRLVVEADLGLRDVLCTGKISLDSARIGGNLNCSVAHPEQPDEASEPSDPRIRALSADRLTVTGRVQLVDLVVDEGVRLADAQIGGELDCAGARLHNSTGPALDVERATVRGPIYLNRGFTAVGEGAGGAVRCVAAELHNQLNCRDGSLRNPTGPALAADRLQVGGDLLLDRLTAAGADRRATIRLKGASVGGRLHYDGASVTNEAGRTYEWHVDGLTYARAPRSGSPDGPRNSWLDLLCRHTPEYAAQPYQQLAAVFRAQGHDGDVRTILMRQRRDQLERGALTDRIDRFWARLTGLLLGYGYQPWRALLGLVGLLAVSVVLTAVLAGHGALVQPVPGGPPSPCSTVDVVGVGLDLGTPFLPNIRSASTGCQLAANPTGSALAVVRWVLQLGAWALAALFVAGFTGIVRKT